MFDDAEDQDEIREMIRRERHLRFLDKRRGTINVSTKQTVEDPAWFGKAPSKVPVPKRTELAF